MNAKNFLCVFGIMALMVSKSSSVDIVLPSELPLPFPPGLIPLRNFLLPLLTGVYNYGTAVINALETLPVELQYSLPVDTVILKENILQVYNQALVFDSILEKVQNSTRKNCLDQNKFAAKLLALKDKCNLALKNPILDTKTKLFLGTLVPFIESSAKAISGNGGKSNLLK